MKYIYIIIIILFFSTTKVIAQHPGGVSSTLGAWYKADDLSSTNYLWRDQSGNGNDAPIEGSIPVPKVINDDFNFNRSYQFVGNEESYFRPIDGNEFQLDDYSFFMILSRNSREVIWSQMKCFASSIYNQDNQQFLIVTNPTNNSFDLRGPDDVDPTVYPSFFRTTINSNSSSVYLANSSREKISPLTSPASSNYYTKLVTDVVSSASFIGGSAIVNNRNDITPQGDPRVPISGPYIGRRLGCNSTRAFNGNVSEIIMYNSNITGTDKMQIESYLAIKYGLTLDHNYLASDGTTTTWDRTINASYNNDIAGIGRDDGSVLHQKQSRSSNTDSFVTFGLGEIASENLNNSYTFPIDKQFLVWGNNNDPLISTTATAPLPFTEKLQRNWLVQKTGTISSVVVMVTEASLLGKFGSVNSLSLVMADDAGYTTGAQIVPLVYNNVDHKWEAIVNFSGTKYFSFFTNIPDYMRNGKYFRDKIEKPMGF